MRTLIIILVILVLLGLAGYSYAKKVINGFGFDLGLSRIDLKQLLSGAGQTNVDLTITITNKSGLSITVDNLAIQVLYNGDVLAYSTNPQDAFVIPPASQGGSVTITHNVTINVGSGDGLAIVNNILTGQKTNFTYTVTGKIFKFFPINYNGTYAY